MEAEIDNVTEYVYSLHDEIVASKIGCTEISFKIANPIELLCDLLAEPKNAADAIWIPKMQFEKNERVYASAMHGNKCIRLQNHCPVDCTMAAVQLYADDTWVSANGRHSAKPMNMVLSKYLLCT